MNFTIEFPRAKKYKEAIYFITISMIYSLKKLALDYVNETVGYLKYLYGIKLRHEVLI